jgi:AcrR family transcriptional regulator
MQADPAPPLRPRGRPRSAIARAAILDAAYDLVVTRGYARVTTAEIAERARAGKQTIYRWWPSKAALVLDALDWWGKRRIDDQLARATGLAAFLRQVCAGATRAAPVLRSLMAEAQFDTDLRKEVRTRLIDQRRLALRTALVQHGVADAARRDTLIYAIYGALWYRLLLDEPLDEDFVQAMVALADRARD